MGVPLRLLHHSVLGAGTQEVLATSPLANPDPPQGPAPRKSTTMAFATLGSFSQGPEEKIRTEASLEEWGEGRAAALAPWQQPEEEEKHACPTKLPQEAPLAHWCPARRL